MNDIYYRDNVVHAVGGKYVVAQWFPHNNQWIAPLTPSERRVCGGSDAYVASNPERLGAHRFATKEAAIRFAQRHYPHRLAEQLQRESEGAEQSQPPS